LNCSDNCLPTLARSIRGGLPPAEYPNVGPTLPLFALHASLLIPWQKMRGPVIERFPNAPGLPRDTKGYLKRVTDAYVTDAYHSLSIEGYQVTADLIERVRAGSWNPEANEDDREQRNAMAARAFCIFTEIEDIKAKSERSTRSSVGL